MKGILGIAVVCLLAHSTDGQITAWTETLFTVTAGTTTPSVTMKLTAKVPETSTAGAAIVTLAATGTGSTPVINYAFTTAGNPGSVGNIATVTSGAITLATGKSLDYESGTSVVFVVTATQQSVTGTNVIGTATVTVEIQNKLEFGQVQYGYCVSDGAAAGTQIGTIKSPSDTATSETVTVASDLTTTADLKFDATSGALSVNTGKTLSQKTTGGYMVTLTATPGGTVASAAGQSIIWVAVATCSGAIQASAVFAVIGIAFATSMLF